MGDIDSSREHLHAPGDVFRPDDMGLPVPLDDHGLGISGLDTLADRGRQLSAQAPLRALTPYLDLQRLADLDIEECHVLLHSGDFTSAQAIMFKGSVGCAAVDFALIFRRGLLAGAQAMTMAHNHPSGDPTPSREDINLTRRLVEAGKLLRLPLHDHVIIARAGVFSFRAEGLL